MNRSDWRKEGFIGLIVGGFSPSWWEKQALRAATAIVAGTCSSWSQGLQQEAKRDECRCLTDLLFCIQSRPPARGMMLPIFRVGLGTSVKPIWKHHRRQRSVILGDL